MADKTGEADIRGINIDKLAKGFAEEAIILKKYCTVSGTSAREIRWYQKTAGFLDSTDSTNVTASQLENIDFGALPDVVDQGYTRNTSYIRKYMVESPMINEEDIKDSDPDIIGNLVRDLVRAVSRRVEKRIYDVLTVADVGTGENTLAITHEWDDQTNMVPISDILTCKEYIQNYSYNPEGAIFLMRPDVNRFLLDYLIAVKGSSIPQFASEKIKDGVVMSILGLRIVVSQIVTTDKAVIFVPKRAITWKSFKGISSVVINEPMIGKKIRVSELGEGLLTDPRAVCFISNIGPT